MRLLLRQLLTLASLARALLRRSKWSAFSKMEQMILSDNDFTGDLPTAACEYLLRAVPLRHSHAASVPAGA